MPQSVHSGGSGSLSHHRFVHVVLLSRDTVVVPVENKNTKVQDIFIRTCDIVNLRETDFFGLAQLKENEFQFLQRDLKISKLTSKIWKCKDSPLDEPLQTFYLRVQYYVENIGLLREKATRLQYYLQMRDNLLHYGQLVAEEKCFLLAAYALQADFGNYMADHHGNDYFDPRQYFPSSVVMRHGQDFIMTHLPKMHGSMAAISPTEAMVSYIRELSTTPHEHNFHFYKMRKRKYDTATVAWVAICPAGLKIYEESNGFRCPVNSFRWPDIGKLNFEKKKFEIISEGTAGPKYTFYFDCKDWAEYIVDLCRQVHQFHLTLQPRLAELQQHFHAQSPSFCEKYVYSENSEGTPNHHQSPSSVGRDGREPAGQTGASGDSSAFGRPKESDDQEGQEIFITTPPSLVSNISSQSMLPHRLKSFESCDSEKLQEIGGLPQKRLFYVSSSNGNGGGDIEYSVDGIPTSFASYSVPASSSESLTVLPFTKADSFQRARSQLLNFSATGSVTPSQASSALTTPSQRSASPSSSAGSSGHLPLSLPISRDVYDAAVLRKSLPHGVHFNDYLQKLWSGQDPVASGSTSSATSFDHLQTNQNSFVEPVQRSSSLRQPLVGLGGNRKGSDSLSQDECELLVMRSNSDKTPKSSKLTLLSKFLGPRPAARETPSPFALPTGALVAGRGDNSRSQNLSLFTASSDRLTSLSSNESGAVARSDSNKSQKSVGVSPSYQASVMLLTDGGKSPKAGLSLPSDTYQHEEERSAAPRKEDGRHASGHPSYPIVPVEAQIQKLVFGPTMTAVSTPVRPAAEKPVGNLQTLSYQSPYAYIPNSFPASVIGPPSRPGTAGILSVPCQDVDIPPDRSCGSPSCSGHHAENRSFPQPCSRRHLSDQNAGTSQVGESVEDDYRERPAPPPYGAAHSTVSSIRFQNPQQQLSTPLRQVTTTHHSQVTVARPFPADAPARQPLPKPDPVMSSVAGKRELSSWVMINNGKSGVQVQSHSSTYNVDQDDQCSTRQEKSTTENHQLKKLSEVLHDEQSIIGDDKTNDISDCRPDHHDPQCPCHGVSSDIRERLRSLMPSVPPMLNALLTDKSLHSTSCTCPGDRRVDASHPSDPSASSSAQLNSRKLRYFPDLSLESEATMIVNGTLSLNGTYELEEIDDESGGGRRAFLSRKARRENGKLVVHHLSDSDQIPRQKAPLGHNQSNSDSAAQSFVSSRC